MLIMLRHAALLAPTPSRFRAASRGRVTATALSIFHNHDASAIILI